VKQRIKGEYVGDILIVLELARKVFGNRLAPFEQDKPIMGLLSNAVLV
jgi:hypothetical protein